MIMTEAGSAPSGPESLGARSLSAERGVRRCTSQYTAPWSMRSDLRLVVVGCSRFRFRQVLVQSVCIYSMDSCRVHSKVHREGGGGEL